LRRNGRVDGGSSGVQDLLAGLAGQRVRPDDRLSPAQQKEWDRVLDVLSNVGGEDLRHVVCFAGLLDHCKQIPSD
jgi:hypothetical protein